MVITPQIVKLTPVDLSSVLLLEGEVVASLPRPDQLRRNTLSMWQTCLTPPHAAFGIRVGERLVALAVLYFPQADDRENLSLILPDDQSSIQPSANYKICMVHPDYRGHGWQCQLGFILERQALHLGVRMLCATVSPYNSASIRSLQKLGYVYRLTVSKYGFERHLYCKKI